MTTQNRMAEEGHGGHVPEPMSVAGHCLSEHRGKEEVKIVLKPPCRSPLLSKILLLRPARGASQTHTDSPVP